MADLVDELLEAHEDTAHLAHELAREREWAIHLGYLKDLGSKAREALVRESQEKEWRCSG